MRWTGFVAASLALIGCAKGPPSTKQVASAEAKSAIGPISKWKLDPAVNRTVLQQMRDRAYEFCLAEKAAGSDCVKDQDWSLFTYANGFAVYRQFRSEADPKFPFAVGYKGNPSAFEWPQRYCLSVYVDAGSRDARSLGPCMSAATGGDYFGIVPVP